MSRIFLSHSSANNAAAIAFRDWLVAEGWSDIFLDLDPNRGIVAGERWERALNEAARRCEAVLFLISRAWLSSRWCMNELTLARRLNKRLFGVLIEEGLAFADLPGDITSHWQVVNLATGRDHQQFRVKLPVTGEEQHVTFSHEGLSRLKAGLQRAGLHASYFAWPPDNDLRRTPYRGMRPLEADDAGIFFGREAPVIEVIDRLRGLTEAAPPRLMVILGASGAGKSSFLRAGLLPRLARDPQTFLPFPVIRPERAAITGETGLVTALAGAFEATPLKVARGEIREAVAGGAATLKPLLARLQEAAQPPTIDGGAAPKLPTLVLAIDQGEELFLAEAQGEAQPFLVLLRDLVIGDKPAIIVVFTIRSDNYERLQSAAELEGVHKLPFDLGPMPKGSYAEVVKGPIDRLAGTVRAIRLDDALVDALLGDIEAGGPKDALPLLAFTLSRLYEEYGATGQLTVDQFNKLGRVKGSIEAAVNRAFAAADMDNHIPRDRETRLMLLRRGLIPWLAGIDADTKAPRRRVARLSEIPGEARPLIDLLVEQRLLSTDVSKDTGETTIEPAHEALLRQWDLLRNWLKQDAELLLTLEGIKRATNEWIANNRSLSWLSHTSARLQSAVQILDRTDLAIRLTKAELDYVSTCQAEEHKKAVTAIELQAQKMEAIGQLSGGIAHDFNNILTGILGFSDLLTSTLPSNDPIYQDIISIRQSANRGAAMVSQLLKFSRRQSVHRELINLNNIISDMAHLLRRVIGEEINLQTTLSPDLWLVRVDRSQIEQVIVNLVLNSRDALPSGGLVRLSTRNLGRTEKAERTAVFEGDHVCIEVSDNGTGMSQATLARAFEPFFTTKEVGKGTGLGLSTAYGIVKQLGGFINIESEVGRGTSAFIYFPREDGKETAAEPSSIAAPTTLNLDIQTTRGAAILLVDDEEAVRTFMAKALRRTGHHVVVAADGAEALHFTQQMRDCFDLVISNIRMPLLDGPSFIRQLRQVEPETSVLFTSGYPADVLDDLQADPRVSLLQKPFSLTGLLSTVALALDRMSGARKPLDERVLATAEAQSGKITSEGNKINRKFLVRASPISEVDMEGQKYIQTRRGASIFLLGDGRYHVVSNFAVPSLEEAEIAADKVGLYD